MPLGNKELGVNRKYGVCFTEVLGRGLVFWISGWRFGHDSAGAGTLEGFEGVAVCVKTVSCPSLSTSPPFLCWAFHLPEVFLFSMGRDALQIWPVEIAEKNMCFVLKCFKTFLCAKLGFWVFFPPVLSVGVPKYLIVSSETFPWSNVKQACVWKLTFFQLKGDFNICMSLLILRGLCYVCLRCLSWKLSILMLSDPHLFPLDVCLFNTLLFSRPPSAVQFLLEFESYCWSVILFFNDSFSNTPI